MHANHLIFSRDMRGSRLYRVNPLLFPQEQTTNEYHLARERDLPAHGLTLRFYGFDFGFSDPAKTVPPYGTAEPFGVPFGKNFLVASITGCSATVAGVNPPAAGVPGAQKSPSFLFNFLHTHGGKTRQWFNKNLTDVEGLGTGQDPQMFRSPPLILQGDTLTCQVQNLGNSTLQVQIVLTGGEF
jgi:hypothetical protein